MDRDYEFLDDSPKSRSTFKWILIIATGVLVGNILSFTAYEAFNFLKWKLILETATTEINKQTQKLKQHTVNQNRQNLIRQKELKQQSIAQ